MLEPLISIVVPIYNVEDFLPCCIDSLLAQTYSNLEIILVDDGSQDNCPAICDQYAVRDPRIHVIHKENGGVSSARNAGINIANGEFIGFVDSDDFVDKRMFEMLLNAATCSNADLTICNLCFTDENGITLSTTPDNSLEYKDSLSCGDLFSLLVKYPNTKYVVVYNKLYMRSLFDECRFPEGMRNEDSYIIHHIYAKSRKTVFIPDALYYYRARQGSIMNSPKSIRNFDVVSVLLDRINLLYQQNYTDLAQQVAVQAAAILVDTYIQIKPKNSALKHRVNELRISLINIVKFTGTEFLSNAGKVRVWLLHIFPVYVLIKKTYAFFNERNIY